jgi:hypothetical protein
VWPGLESLVQVTLVTAREALLSRRRRGPLRWWREQLSPPGDAVDRLFSFAIDFQTRGAPRREAEAHLVAAFLDDVAGRYGAFQAGSRTAIPLILLDNAHAAPGPAFLALMERRYAASRGEGRAPVHPVTVATALGEAGGGRLSFHDVGRETPWEPSEGWLLRLGINQVRESDIRAMLRARLGPVRYPANLERPIARLSGGRAGCARVLVDAAVAHLRSGGSGGSGGGTPSLTGRELLALDHADGDAEGGNGNGNADRPGSVADRLLELLLPGQMRLRVDDMTLTAAALGDDAARLLLRRHGTPRPETDADVDWRLRNVKSELDGAHWNREPWPAPAAPVVGDRALRLLLLHRLAARADDWRAAHAALAAGLGPSAGAPFLHHTLALGDADAVADHLRVLFTRLPPPEWLTAVNVVCAAPTPPGGEAAPPEAEPEDPVRLAIRRLVRALWRLSDAMTLTPDPVDLREVGSALDQLHAQPGADTQNVYLRAEAAWPERLAEGVQAPDLPIPKGDPR